jgi:hypothetical protein
MLCLLLETVLQAIDHFKICFLRAHFSWLEKPRNHMGRDLDTEFNALLAKGGTSKKRPLPHLHKDLT